jgi:hypothetical protein
MIRTPQHTSTVRAATLLILLASSSPALAASAAIDPDGNMTIDGEPFFPIGMYHVSWIGNRQGEDAIPDLSVLAEAGFNSLHATVDARTDTLDFLDACEARGLWLFAETPSPPDDFINLWKSHPALVAWNIADDFNAPYSGTPNHPVAEVVARRDLTQSLAPAHLTYASGGSYPGYRIAEYAGAAGVLAFQSYPIASQTSPFEDELEEVAESWAYVTDELAGSGQVVFANPQSFRWGGGRWPTVSEQRNMLYTTLLYGPKGVLWYAYWDGGQPLPQLNATVWNEVVREVTELKTLTPFLLHGQRAVLSTGALRVYAAAWEHDGQLVVAVTNTDRSDAPSVSVTLPGGAIGIAQPLFPLRDESGFVLAGNELGGSIGPEEAHVYVIDVEQPGNDSPTAAFSVTPAAAVVDENVHFDAGPSFDGDGSVASVHWDFGDGASAAGLTADHVYTRHGTYAVRATVRDDLGAAATAFETLVVGITDLCDPAPRLTCTSAASAKCRFRDPTLPGRAQITWRWRGPQQPVADFGDPTATNEIALCVYDDGGLRLATSVPAGAGWQTTSKGFRFKNREGEPGGVTAVRLSSAATTALRARAKGAHLAALDAPLGSDVIVQLVTGDTTACWTCPVSD